MKKATANILPTKKNLQFKEKIRLYLEVKLHPEAEDLSQKVFHLVNMNLIATIILQNASRSGTVSVMRSEYIDKENLFTDKVSTELQCNL